ncbi:MAG: hypothetical protein GX307_00590 [Euryarchaeota archaeon]|nr:hypothetical protein [Euryarchaeota archaeon]
MLRFQKDQTVFRIGAVDFGGQPGMRRTVMICPIGLTDEYDLDAQRSMFKEVTGEYPTAILVTGSSSEEIADVLELAKSLNGVPIIIDASSISDAFSALAEENRADLATRVICGGLNVTTPLSVWENVQELRIKAAMLDSFHPLDDSLKGRIYALEDGGDIIDEGLLDRSTHYGITMPMINVGGNGPGGSGLRALLVAKAKWGLPTGCDLRDVAKKAAIGPEGDLTAATLSQSAGADYVFASSPKNWARTARALSFVDSLMAEACAEM